MKTKLIFSPQLAQYLLHHDVKLIELKPKRGNERETVYVFHYDDTTAKLISEWLKLKQ